MTDDHSITLKGKIMQKKEPKHIQIVIMIIFVNNKTENKIKD